MHKRQTIGIPLRGRPLRGAEPQRVGPPRGAPTGKGNIHLLIMVFRGAALPVYPCLPTLGAALPANPRPTLDGRPSLGLPLLLAIPLACRGAALPANPRLTYMGRGPCQRTPILLRTGAGLWRASRYPAAPTLFRALHFYMGAGSRRLSRYPDTRARGCGALRAILPPPS